MESLRLPIALLWILFDLANAAQVYVNVDDTDPRITYTGNNWTAVDNCAECGAGLNISRLEGGSYHMAHQTDSKAEFVFTGIAVSVYGVTMRHWRRMQPNVSFTIDGTEKIMQLTNATGGGDFQYNQTMFQVDSLPNGPHTLSIQTHDNSLFVLDYLTYTTNVATIAAAPNGTDSTESASASPTTSSYDQSASSSSPPTGAQPVVVGGVIGGIFGAFLIAGIIGLWFIRRANRHRRASRKGLSNRNKHPRTPRDRKGLFPEERRGRGRSNTVDSWSSFGGSSDQEQGGKRDDGGRREDKRLAGIPVDYAFSGQKSTSAPVPLKTMRKMEAPSEAANNGGGRDYLSASSTFASSSSSGGEDGKEHIVHALTTDTPQHAHPIPLYGASQWPSSKRPNTADAATLVNGASQWQNTKRPNMADEMKPFKSGSTLEVDGVLERATLNHSNVPGHSSREEESPALFFSDHPFRTMGSG